MAEAKRHHDDTGHKVWAEQTLSVKYGEQIQPMNNPHTELRKYLYELIRIYLNIDGMYKQLKNTCKRNTSAKIKARTFGSYFFSLVSYSLRHTIQVELSRFLSKKEEISLFSWLKRAKEYSESVRPTRYNATSGKRECIEPKKYCDTINDQIAQLRDRQDVIDRIRMRRNKIVHLDENYFYFNDLKKLDMSHGIDDSELDDLMEVVRCILQKHYSCLFEGETDMEAGSARRVNRVLKHMRAWMQAWDEYQ